MAGRAQSWQAVAEYYAGKNVGDLNTLSSLDGVIVHHHSGIFDGEWASTLARRSQRPLWELGCSEDRLVRLGAGVLNLVPEERGLDVGCGRGGSALMLARDYGAQIDGINICGPQITFARDAAQQLGLCARVDFREENVYDRKRPPAHYDFVWACESTEYFDDLPGAFKEFARVLRPGGRVVVFFLAVEKPGRIADELRRRFDGHYLTRLADRAVYQRALRRAGFTVELCHDLRPAVAPYWELRRAVPQATGIEDLMIASLDQEAFSYDLLVARLPLKSAVVPAPSSQSRAERVKKRLSPAASAQPDASAEPPSEVREIRDLVRARIAAALHERLADVPPGLAQELVSFASGGKQVCPSLFALLSSTRAADWRTEGELRAAAAIELAHRASLITDDLADGSERRNDSRCLNRSIGSAQALFAVNLFEATAFEIAGEGTARAIAWAARERAAGQIIQQSFEWHPRQTAVERLTRVVARKSGTFAACAAHLALGGDGRGPGEAVALMARYLALGLQTCNDLAPLFRWLDETEEGNGSTPDDVRNVVPTLPLALAAEGPLGRDWLRLLLAGNEGDPVAHAQAFRDLASRDPDFLRRAVRAAKGWIGGAAQQLRRLVAEGFPSYSLLNRLVLDDWPRVYLAGQVDGGRRATRVTQLWREARPHDST